MSSCRYSKFFIKSNSFIFKYSFFISSTNRIKDSLSDMSIKQFQVLVLGHPVVWIEYK